MSSKIVNNIKHGHMNAVLLSLLQPNNTITTLELKYELRRKHPEYSWFQADISKFMSDLSKENVLEYVDNGTYRTYSGKTEVTKVSAKVKRTTKSTPKVVKMSTKVKDRPKTKKISKSKAFDLMLGSKGSFFTAEFMNKENELRVMNCQCLKDQDPKLGYIKVREASKMRSNPEDSIRQINIQTLVRLKIGGEHYRI